MDCSRAAHLWPPTPSKFLRVAWVIRSTEIISSRSFFISFFLSRFENTTFEVAVIAKAMYVWYQQLILICIVRSVNRCYLWLCLFIYTLFWLLWIFEWSLIITFFELYGWVISYLFCRSKMSRTIHIARKLWEKKLTMKQNEHMTKLVRIRKIVCWSARATYTWRSSKLELSKVSVKKRDDLLAKLVTCCWNSVNSAVSS